LPIKRWKGSVSGVELNVKLNGKDVEKNKKEPEQDGKAMSAMAVFMEPTLSHTGNTPWRVSTTPPSSLGVPDSSALIIEDIKKKKEKKKRNTKKLNFSRTFRSSSKHLSLSVFRSECLSVGNTVLISSWNATTPHSAF